MKKFCFVPEVLKNLGDDQRGELPPLPFGNPIGKVPAPRGGVLEKKTLLALFFYALSLNLAFAQALPTPVADALRQHKLTPDGLSVYVQNATNDQPLLAFNADIPRNPASTIKTLATFAGLDMLGLDFTWNTEVYVLGRQRGDVLEGDLLLKGYGDPFFTVDDLWKLSRAVRDRGLRQINGNLLIDDSYFAPIMSDPGAFDGKPYEPYNALPNALLINFQAIEFLFRPSRTQVMIAPTPAPTTLRLVNKLQLTRGQCKTRRIAMTVTPGEHSTEVIFRGRYPASCGESSLYRAVMPARQLAAGSYHELWLEQGGVLQGQYQAAISPNGVQPLYVQASRPLAELIRGMNKYSNNVMTRQLFLTLGAQRFGPPATLDKSRQAIIEWLLQNGLQFPELVLDNGAGLSRDTRISARHLGQLLLWAFRSDYAPEFLASLPLAGIDGTMRRRFRKEDLVGKARFKTGTLKNVRAIAGYLQHPTGRTYAVVMLHNAKNVQYGVGSRVQDALLRWLYAQP